MAVEILLDVADLEPPEPLQKVLDALDSLPEGHYLRVIHRREPECLFPLIEQLGFAHECRSSGDGRFEIFVWGQSDNLAALAVHKTVSK